MKYTWGDVCLGRAALEWARHRRRAGRGRISNVIEPTLDHVTLSLRRFLRSSVMLPRGLCKSCRARVWPSCWQVDTCRCFCVCGSPVGGMRVWWDNLFFFFLFSLYHLSLFALIIFLKNKKIYINNIDLSFID